MTTTSTMSDFLSILPALEIALPGEGGVFSLNVEAHSDEVAPCR